jgi:hypothetical protein
MNKRADVGRAWVNRSRQRTLRREIAQRFRAAEKRDWESSVAQNYD